MSNALSKQDEQRLEKTQHIRERIIEELIKSKPVPEDESDRKLLIAALDGMDRAVLNKAKVKIEEANSETQAQHASIVSNFLKQLRVQEIISNNKREGSPQLPQEMRPERIVDGEMDIGLSDLNYETFSKNI